MARQTAEQPKPLLADVQEAVAAIKGRRKQILDTLFPREYKTLREDFGELLAKIEDQLDTVVGALEDADKVSAAAPAQSAGNGASKTKPAKSGGRVPARGTRGRVPLPS